MNIYKKLTKNNLLFDDNGCCYKELVTISKKTFEELNIKLKLEINNKYPLYKVYTFDSKYKTSFLKELELKENKCFLNMTQFYFINMFLKLKIKPSSNVCLKVK